MTDALLDGYLEHLATGDAAAAIGVARALLDDGHPVDAVVERLVTTAQEEVGRRWERNEWSVAQEHAATAVSEAVLDVLLSADDLLASDRPVRGRLVAVCVEGEWHTLALRVVTALVRRAHWQATFLGPSVPAGQLGRYLHDMGPDGLLVSCSVSLHLPGARRVIEVARATGTPVLAGGGGFGPGGRWAEVLGADAWAGDARTTIERLSAWDRFTTPAPPLTHPGVTEHTVLERDIDDLVARAHDVLGGSCSLDGSGPDGTREDLQHLFRYLSAALLVDDAAVVTGYVTWLERVLTSRGRPPALVRAMLEAARAALGPSLPCAAELLPAP